MLARALRNDKENDVMVEIDKITYLIHRRSEFNQTTITAKSIVDPNEGKAESLTPPCKEESWLVYRENVAKQEYKVPP